MKKIGYALQEALAYHSSRQARNDQVIVKAFKVDEEAAAKNRKRIAKKQKYHLTDISKSGDTCDIFQRSAKMARMQKIGVTGERSNLTPVKPQDTMMLGGKLIPVRLATKR